MFITSNLSTMVFIHFSKGELKDFLPHCNIYHIFKCHVSTWKNPRKLFKTVVIPCLSDAYFLAHSLSYLYTFCSFYSGSDWKRQGKSGLLHRFRWQYYRSKTVQYGDLLLVLWSTRATGFYDLMWISNWTIYSIL